MSKLETNERSNSATKQAAIEVAKNKERSLKRLREFCADASKVDWLFTDWEKNFLLSLKTIVANQFGYADLTEKQRVSYDRLEQKVYK